MAERQFSERTFSARCSMIKKALTTVISTFYQHFDDCFCYGHLFDSSLFICFTIDYKLMPNCFYFEGNFFFVWWPKKGRVLILKCEKGRVPEKKGRGEHPAKSA